MERKLSVACAITLPLILVIGCAGRAANPVMVYQYGDEQQSCGALIETEIFDLLPQREKADKNTKLGVTGIFLLVPFLLMDISKSEQVEANALIKRYNHLLGISEEEACGLEQQAIPEFQKTDY